MITLTIILIIWGIISYIRIYKKCKRCKYEFNPLEGKLIDYAGFLIGITTFILSFVAICITYLP